MLAVGGVCLPQAADAQLDWSLEVVDPNTIDSDSFDAGVTTIRLDSTGKPWISYATGPIGGSSFTLKLASLESGEWATNTIDFDTWGTGSLALDSTDTAHVCYRRSNMYAQGVIWYATGADDVWDISNVDPTLGLTTTSITVDAFDQPHRAYGSGNYASGNRCLKYARWTGLEWDIQELDTGGERSATSIVIDSSGLPHISYVICCVAGQRQVKYAHFNGSEWEIDAIDTVQTPLSTSIALDSLERPHIAYTMGALDGIKYASKVGDEWESELIAEARIWYARLALGSDDEPRIAYYHADDGALTLATRDAGEWVVQVVDDDPSPSVRTGRFPSIAMGADNSVHISYYSHGGAPNKLKYAHSAAPCIGDLDGDGAIGLADLAVLLAHYPTESGAQPEDGDIDGDGDIDLSDLAALLAVYGTDCD